MPAKYDVAQENLRHNGAFWVGRIRNLAIRGYMTTIFDLERRLLQGDPVKKKAGRALYWQKRAQKEILDRSSITQQTVN
jgi:hypothetical protein